MNTETKSADALELALRAGEEIRRKGVGFIPHKCADIILSETKLRELYAVAEALREVLPFAWGLAVQTGGTPNNHDCCERAEQALAALDGGGK